MSDRTQHELLQATKEATGLGWDALAEKAGIKPRALKTYRMPVTSQDFRTMPSLAREAVERLFKASQKRVK